MCVMGKLLGNHEVITFKLTEYGGYVIWKITSIHWVGPGRLSYMVMEDEPVAAVQENACAAAQGQPFP